MLARYVHATIFLKLSAVAEQQPLGNDLFALGVKTAVVTVTTTGRCTSAHSGMDTWAAAIISSASRLNLL